MYDLRRLCSMQRSAFGVTGCVALLLLLRTLGIGASPQEGQGVAVAPLNVFTLQQQLSAPDAVADDGFGESIAISGNTAVIGADTAPIQGRSTARGAAYVFVRNGAIWTFQAKLVPNDASPGMLFGRTVAISGDIAIVGAPSHDLPGRPDAGAAYVFRRTGNLWQQDARVVGDSAAMSFGQAVSIDNATIVVGSDDAERRGAAFVFVQGLPATPAAPFPWRQQQKLLAPNGQADDDFAESVVVRSNTVIAGARDAQVGGVRRGAAYVFNRVGSLWTAESQEIVAPDGQDRDEFGRRVAFDGVRAMIAAPDARVNGVSSGAAYVFLRQGAGWTFEQKLTPDVPRTDTDFGGELAIDGALAVAGIPESGTRAAFVFRFSAGTWARERVDPAATSRLQSVALQGTNLLVGSDRLGAPGTAQAFVDQESGNGAVFVPPVLAAAVVTGSTVNLNWNAVPTATRYQLRAGTSPGGSNAFDGNVGNTTALIASDVPNGTYFVRVHAITGTTESAASNEVRVDVGPGGTCQVPAASANLTFTRTGSLVTLTWTVVTNATSYVVEAGSSSGASNIVIIDTGNAVTQLTATAPPGTYFVRVRGKSVCGVGPASNQVVITVS
jgi:hypothetical protein